jgi:hypothetical protein
MEAGCLWVILPTVTRKWGVFVHDFRAPLMVDFIDSILEIEKQFGFDAALDIHWVECQY